MNCFWPNTLPTSSAHVPQCVDYAASAVAPLEARPGQALAHASFDFLNGHKSLFNDRIANGMAFVPTRYPVIHAQFAIAPVRLPTLIPNIVCMQCGLFLGGQVAIGLEPTRLVTRLLFLCQWLCAARAVSVAHGARPRVLNTAFVACSHASFAGRRL